MRDDKVKENYSTNAGIYDETRFHNLEGRIMDKKQKKVLLSYISKFPKNAKILEAGCGSGRFLEFLEKKGYKNLYGIDQAKNMVDIAKKRTIAKLKIGDVYKLPYNESEFDIVFSVHVMMHIDLPKKMLNEMMRVSKNLTIIDINNKSSPFSVLARVFRTFKKIFRIKVHNRPYIFSIKDIEKMSGNKKIMIKPTYMFPVKIPLPTKIYYNITFFLEKIAFRMGLQKFATQLFIGIKK